MWDKYLIRPGNKKFLNYLRIKRGIHEAVCPPGAALKSLLKHISRKTELKLGIYQEELLKNSVLKEIYLSAVNKGWVPKKCDSYEDRFNNLFRSSANISWFYALIRELKPKRVVETGTAAGGTTSMILAALEANNSGKLISIDLPSEKGKNTMNWSLPERQKAGFLVPEQYKHRWELRTGDSKDLLVECLREEPCDIFIHDSLHTYEHMIWEYVTAFLNMQDGKIIISDDVLWNKAWLNFITNFDLRSFQDLSNPNIGVTVIKHKE